jgi:glycosyltransferase involved in cell wall biosynthesis
MRIVVFGPEASSVFRLRASLMRAMIEHGHEVLTLAPDHDAEVRARLADLGIAFATVPLARTGVNPLADVRATAAIVGTLRHWRPDVLLATGAKPVVYGLMGARFAGVRARAAIITGAGSAMSGRERPRQRAVAHILQSLYRVGLRQADVVFFQNDDDETLFRALDLVGEDQRVVRINGSGVELDHFAARPLPPPPVTFLMVARLIKDKGLFEYVEAARSARSVRPDLRFTLVGPLDVNPTAITRAQLDAWRDEGVVEYLGASGDVRPFLAAAHVFVLPSYREGTPRAVLEAMSTGRAIITTDVPGCRETVRAGVNGVLVPARDASALAEAMLSLAHELDGLAAMGAQSRALAEERFDVHEVNRIILRELRLDTTVDAVLTGS